MPKCLHYFPSIPPCRSVLLTAEAVGVELELKVVDLKEQEHMNPEFLEMNPQHCIPTLNDEGFIIWESRAIMGYLVEQYGPDDSLYPRDPKRRAIVNQRLFFDAGILYPRLAAFYYPMMFCDASVDAARLARLEEAFQFLDIFLGGGDDWVAGRCLTIADIALVVSVSTVDALGFDVNKYSKVAKWYNRCKATIKGYYELNQHGALKFRELYDNSTPIK
ncbi:glutathione S-transferase 1-1-like [Periplaneta americana]|uniref:glutathione S-transferase 1-1-like n=1 Tax=Periplaneta americana TaxID=6978 RepID=UPI0037E9AE3D